MLVNVGFVRVFLSQEARLIFEIWLSDILAMFSSVRPTYHRPLKDPSSPLLFRNVGEAKMHIMRYNLKISVETNKQYKLIDLSLSFYDHVYI